MEEPERRAYEPLRGFDGWRDVNPSSDRWDAVVSFVGEVRGEDVDFKWLNGPLRASAYQSGAVEGLHAGDRGLTITLMKAVSNWQAQVREVDEGDEVDTVAFIEAGYDALELALDVATNDRPVTEAWLRELHEVVCRLQQTYLVTTPTGRSQRQLLPKGEYKRDDNHVLLPGGEMLMFAPAQEVRPEMARLVATLGSEEFAAAHSVVQAAFAHHALTHIHPFADGNGRVARTLASVYLLRSVSLPFFMFVDQKPRYLEALDEADAGRVSQFVTFVLERVEDLFASSWSRSACRTRSATETSRSPNGALDWMRPPRLPEPSTPRSTARRSDIGCDQREQSRPPRACGPISLTSLS